MQTRTLLAGLAALTFVGAASADVVAPASITYIGTGTEAEFASLVDENALIDGSGLSGVLAADESNLATVTHANPIVGAGAGNAWATIDAAPAGGDWFVDGDGTVAFEFDLGATHTLDSVAAWGYGFGLPNGNGISDVTLEFYTNGTGAGAADSTQNISFDTVFGVANIVALTEVDANYVRLTVTDNHFGNPDATGGGGDRVGIAEIVFTNNVPEPGSLALLALGGLMVARRRRG